MRHNKRAGVFGDVGARRSLTQMGVRWAVPTEGIKREEWIDLGVCAWVYCTNSRGNRRTSYRSRRGYQSVECGCARREHKDN